MKKYIITVTGSDEEIKNEPLELTSTEYAALLSFVKIALKSVEKGYRCTLNISIKKL